MLRGVFKVGVIGRTGAGNYGHSLDMAFIGNPRARIVAVADPDEAGRAESMARTGAARSYGDFRQMLSTEKPDIVVVAPRHVDCHLEMVLAAAEAGAHVYCEKPVAQTPVQADQMIAAVDRSGVKLAVALPFVHERRAAILFDMLREGVIGQLKSMRAICKCDHRGGGQDFIVLGLHFADMMRRIAGDPLWCWGRVSIEGRGISPADVVQGDEGVGPMAGDGIIGQYLFPGGVVGTIESWRIGITERPRQPYRLELYGTTGMLVVRAPYADHSIWFNPEPFYRPGDSKWVRVPTPEVPTYGDYHKPAAADLMGAIEHDREPLCSGLDGRTALEMILAPYEAQKQGRPVPLPLADRRHPLTCWETEGDRCGT